ncbi:MAG TPA: TonB-dependent receptor [Bryobacteraceae bacterium]|nr:TonB-dependent receptor [Bryobacteraceae bacterium]
MARKTVRKTTGTTLQWIYLLQCSARSGLFGGMGAALLLLTGSLGWAQTQTPPPLSETSQGGASIRGHAIDPSGLAVADATVSVRNVLTGQVVTQKTNPDGTFSIDGLAPGIYAVSIANSGLRADLVQADLAAGDNEDEGDVRLSLASSSQQVTVVSGSRITELEQDSPTKVLAVTHQQMQDTGYERIGDVLSEVPGVVTRAQGYGIGITSGEQIDGMDSKETLVLMDGLPIASGRGIDSGFVNLNQQSVGPIQQVEVVKGAASALYGTDALGGVINLITRDPSDPLDIDAQISGGTLGMVDGRFDIGGQWKKLTGFLDLENHHIDSYSLIPPDTVGAQEDRQSILAKLRYTFSPRAAIGFTTTAYHDHQNGISEAFGVDPTNPFASALTELHGNDSTQTYALTGDFLPTQSTTLQARLYGSRFLQDSISDLVGVPNSGFDPGNLEEDYRRGDLAAGRKLGSWNYLQGGYEWVHDRYKGDNRIVNGNEGQELTTNDLWFQDRMQPSRNLALTLGGRFQNNSSYGNHIVPKAGLVYRINDHFVWRAGFGLGFRAPNLGELYYQLLHLEYGYQVIGNPTLKPETSQSLSTGVTYIRDRFQISANLFRNNLKNLIDNVLICDETSGQNCAGPVLASLLGHYGVPGTFGYDTTGAAFFTFINLNVDRACTQGFDIDGRIAITPTLKFSGAYAYLEAVDTINHIWLPNRNRNQGHIKLEYAKPRWGLLANIRGTFFSNWLVAAASDGSPADWAYGYAIWNLYASKTLGHGLQIFGAIDNFANSRDRKLEQNPPSYDRFDYGRMFRIGMRYSLPHHER